MHFATFILKNLTRRPTRTALTVLGLAVAVASMITLLGISSNAEHSVESAFAQRGVDLVVTQAGRSSGLNSDFSEYFVDEARKIPGVKQVAWAVVNLIDVTRDSGYTDQIMIQGWQPDNFGFEDMQILSGRKLDEGDRARFKLTGLSFAALRSEKGSESSDKVPETVLAKLNPLKDREFSRDDFVREISSVLDKDEFKRYQNIILKVAHCRKVMLGSTVADNLNKHVGDTVVFGRREAGNTENVFEVIGIFKSFVVFENGSAIVLLEEGRILTGMRVTGFSVRINKSSPDSPAEVEAVREKIEALRDPKDPSVRLAAQTPESYTSTISHLQMVRALTWVVSVVALLIGVIGMLNTMAMSVLERTQEIGILRAVGWPPGRVMRMILGEATILSLAAAAVGTVGAAIAMHLLTLSPKVNGFIEGHLAMMVVAEGFAITLVIGLVGGAYPAFRAARLLPTEAIRHD